MLLPSKHHVVDLIVGDNHQRMLHSGVNTTLTSVRERFWILQGRRAVKRCLRRCVTCRKEQGRHSHYHRHLIYLKNEFLIVHLSHTQVWTSQALYTRQTKVEQTQMKLEHTFVCLRAPPLELYTWS